MQSISKKIIFLVPAIEQPRIVNRIIEFGLLYDKVDVLAFTRGLYDPENHNKLNPIVNVEVTELGYVENAKYFQRTFKYFKLIFLILVKYGFRKKNIYVFGMDLGFLCHFVINKEVTYEISDIIWLYKSRFAQKVLRSIDFYCARKSKHVVFTSEGFYNRYYMFLKKENVSIKENKIKSNSRISPIDYMMDDKVRIAYIGVFRYFNIIKNLISSVTGNNSVVLNFYGEPESDSIFDFIMDSANSHNNIFYHGKFMNPENLESIYGDNNINFVAYDNKLYNEQVAMPNKFYESGYFNIPIVCSSKTLVGERVAKLGMGWVIEPNKEGIRKFLSDISLDEIVECHERMKKLDKSLFVSDV